MADKLQIASVSSRTPIRDLEELVSFDCVSGYINAYGPYEILNQACPDTSAVQDDISFLRLSRNTFIHRKDIKPQRID